MNGERDELIELLREAGALLDWRGPLFAWRGGGPGRMVKA